MKEILYMSLKTFETSFGGRPLRVEIGEVAKQTNASALLNTVVPP